jgi:hypothetical protein
MNTRKLLFYMLAALLGGCVWLKIAIMVEGKGQDSQC